MKKKYYLILIFNFVFTFFVNAQNCVDYSLLQSDIGINSTTFGVSLADFDGDDDNDVVIIDAYNDIEVFFNNGDGTFDTVTHAYGLDRWRYGVHVLDIENDGDFDFVTVPFSKEDFGLEIWENDGSGNFTLKTDDLATNTDGEQLAVGDVNNDGYTDIFYTHDDGINVFLNDQNGNFNDNGLLSTSNCNQALLSDVDNDGDLDAIVSRSNSPSQIWLNDGNGNFTDSGQELTDEYDPHVAAGDIDDDNDVDLIFAPWHGSLQIWINDGVGNYLPGDTLFEANEFFNDIILKDQNFDTYPDIFTNEYIWVNNPQNPGEFIIQDTLDGSSTHDIEVVDINNNNLLDIYYGVFSSDNGDKIFVREEPEYIFNDTTLCYGDSLFAAYQWQTEPGEFWENAGCDSVLITYLDFYDEVNTNVTQNGDTLTAEAQGDTVSYQWIDCQDFEPIPGETEQEFTPDETGNYAVIIFVNHNQTTCSDTSDCYEVIITNIAGNENKKFNIYPNPTNNGIFTINSQNRMDYCNIIISDIAGKTIFTQDEFNFLTSQINISSQPTGVYFIKIKTSDSVFTGKIIKN